MDIREKQNTDVIRRILNALGTERGLSDDVGVIQQHSVAPPGTASGQIVMQSAWHRDARTGERTDLANRKYLVVTTVTVETTWIQVNGMAD